MSQSPHDDLIKKEIRAKALIDNLAKHDYLNAVAHFDSMLTSVMPASALEELWKGILEKAGPFEKQLSGRASEGNPTVILDCKFEKGNVEFLVTFDEHCNVSGLHMRPETEKPAVEAKSAEASSPVAQ